MQYSVEYPVNLTWEQASQQVSAVKSLPPELIPYSVDGRIGPGTWGSDRLSQVAHFRHWAFVAADTICEAMASHKIRVGEVGDDGEITNYPIDHPAQVILDNPNSVDTYWSYMYVSMAYLLTTGVTYWWIKSFKNELLEQWYLPSHWVWPWYKSGKLWAYKVYPSYGQPIIIPPEEIVECRIPSPLYPMDALSKLWACSMWVDTAEQLDISQLTAFSESIIPSILLELTGPYGGAPLSQDQSERLKAKLRERLQGANKVGAPFVLEPGVKPHIIESKREMHYDKSSDTMRDKILAIYKVPKTMVGVLNVVNRATAESAEYVFHRWSLSPKEQFISETLTKFYRKFYNNSRIIVYYPEHEPVPSELKNQTWKLHKESGAVYANEYRKAYGMAPLADDFLLGAKVTIREEPADDEHSPDEVTGADLDDIDVDEGMSHSKSKLSGRLNLNGKQT